MTRDTRTFGLPTWPGVIPYGEWKVSNGDSSINEGNDGSMRWIGYVWAFPVTAVGLCLALVAVVSGGTLHLRDGVVEVAGGLVGFLLRGNRHLRGGAAMCLGHVILARDAECLERSRRHELHHVRQFER